MAINVENLNALANDLPEGLRENALALIERMGEVIEGIGDKPITWKPGMLRLVQGTTDRSTLPKGTAIGSFVLGEEVVEQPLEFIPIRIWTARQYWSPDQTDNRTLCSSPDAKLGYLGSCNGCPHAKFDEVARKSECAKVKNVLVIKRDLSDVFIIPFQKTNYQVGMELEGLMKKANVPVYKRVYGLVSKTNSQFKNVENFSIETLSNDKKIVPADAVPFLKALFEAASEDRKESLNAFYEFVESRRNQQRLAGPSEENGKTLQLTDETEASGEVSPLAKDYQV